jgi:Baseplate J-like protein
MSQYAKEINHILATLNEQRDEDNALPDEEELDTIHVYPVEGGGILLTRTPLEPDEAAPPVIDSQDDHPTTGAARRTPPPFVLFLVLLCLLVCLDMADSQLIALMTPTATITLVPQTHTVTTTTDLPAAAIHAHAFSPLTLSVSQTIPATGVGHQEARYATGTLIFYNGLFTPQFIAPGTVFTGTDGVAVATTQGVAIPPGNPTSGYGTVAVPARALQIGAQGNIAAGDITITINNGVLVKNSPLTNGQDARTYAIVRHADIQRAVTQLTPRVLQSAQAALSAELQAGEQLFPAICSRRVTSSQQPGDEATHVTVTVAETCSTTAYTQQALEAQGEQLLNMQARALGKGYSLVGDLHPTILTPSTTAWVRVQFSATYVYQINPQKLANLIAGQPKHDALVLLSKITGIQHATIAGVLDDDPLPLDPSYIHFRVLIGIWR